MNSKTIEIYRPRSVSNLGQWDIGGLGLKVYGLVADNKTIDGAMVTLAQSFVRQGVLPRVADEGDDNGMGFVIIHLGSLVDTRFGALSAYLSEAIFCHRTDGYSKETCYCLCLGTSSDKRRARDLAKNDDERRAQSVSIHGRSR